MTGLAGPREWRFQLRCQDRSTRSRINFPSELGNGLPRRMDAMVLLVLNTAIPAPSGRRSACSSATSSIAANAPWKRRRTEGVTFECQVLLSGEDGGPEALRFRFDDCPSVYAHMHLTAQFQLLLGGAMDFPRGVKHLEAPAIHYTDHNMPYGPFAVSGGHDMLVLHPEGGRHHLDGEPRRAAPDQPARAPLRVLGVGIANGSRCPARSTPSSSS